MGSLRFNARTTSVRYTNLDLDGGETADLLIGGNGNDTLNGNGGNDWLYGGAGNDTIDGGSGDDRLYGGSGDDRLSGGDGNDTIEGGDGSDWMAGGIGDNVLLGGDGNDLIFAVGSSDYVDGGRGDDQILARYDGVHNLYGGDGNDIVVSESETAGAIASGGDGDDVVIGYADMTLLGDAGNDIVQGQAGAQIINGGQGADILAGGGGADTFRFGTSVDENGALVSDSAAHDGAADVIRDFDTFTDVIEGAGQGGQLYRFQTSATWISGALADFNEIAAREEYAETQFAQVFLYNEEEDRGYLLWDSDQDGAMDSGVVLDGCGQAGDFNEWNLA